MTNNEKIKQVLDFIKEKGTTNDLDCLSATKLSFVELQEALAELKERGDISISDTVSPQITYIG